MEVQLRSLLLPFLQVGLHHLHKVFWGTVAISWHIHQSKVLPDFEEIHLLCVALGRGFKKGKSLRQRVKKLL